MEAVAREAGSIYRRLFEHGPAVRGEAEFFCAKFEGNGRTRELDELLRTSHALNAALETQLDERLSTARVGRLLSQLDAAAGTLERTVAGADARRAYSDSARHAQAERCERFERDVAATKAQVDAEVESHLSQLQQHFDRLEEQNFKG